MGLTRFMQLLTTKGLPHHWACRHRRITMFMHSCRSRSSPQPPLLGPKICWSAYCSPDATARVFGYSCNDRRRRFSSATCAMSVQLSLKCIPLRKLCFWKKKRNDPDGERAPLPVRFVFKSKISISLPIKKKKCLSIKSELFYGKEEHYTRFTVKKCTCRPKLDNLSPRKFSRKHIPKAVFWAFKPPTGRSIFFFF